MIIGVSYFGDVAFLPLVKAWWKVYQDSGCRYPVVITTDLKAVLPDEAVPYNPENPAPLSYLRFNTRLYPDIVRNNQAFDVQGAMAIQAIQVLPRCLIVDADAFFVKDPTELIESLPRVMFGMGVDPNTLSINGCSERLNQYQAGVLYYGTDSREDRKRLLQMYRKSFASLWPDNDNAFLEQASWSLVKHELSKTGDSCTLPGSLNWSHAWKSESRRPADAGECYVLHEHGPHKWEFIAGVERHPDTDRKISRKYIDYYQT